MLSQNQVVMSCMHPLPSSSSHDPQGQVHLLLPSAALLLERLLPVRQGLPRTLGKSFWTKFPSLPPVVAFMTRFLGHHEQLTG